MARSTPAGPARRGPRPPAAIEEPPPVEQAEQPVRVVRLGPAAPATPGFPGGYAIATATLLVPGGARAHVAGERVPVGNVERNGWTDLVRPPVDGE